MAYSVITGSTSGHCCFEYTVSDDNGQTICETFDEQSAIRICAALNGVDAAKVLVMPRPHTQMSEGELVREFELRAAARKLVQVV